MKPESVASTPAAIHLALLINMLSMGCMMMVMPLGPELVTRLGMLPEQTGYFSGGATLGAALVRPDSGRIMLDGHDITSLPMYRRAILGLGYLPQETSIFRGLSVEENISAVLEVSEPDPQARAARLEQLLGEFNIARLRSAPAMALSGGERRRCEIARALAASPSIMLLDEPFAGIDPISIADIRTLVSHLKDRDIGVLITDHNVRETLEIVDRACIIYDGRVLFEGTPDALVKDETVRRVYLGEDFAL